jgi:peptidoglycan/LPS O-acetylase OafA/YrhL
MNQRHHNNFDFLRFVFALFVLISHSFALLGIANQEWLVSYTNGQLSFSDIGLAGFFVISGYFIYKSLVRSSGIWDYLKKRFLRLFPALFVVLFLTILIIPFLYDGPIPLRENLDYWSYLPNNLSLYGFQGTVDGVFANLPYHSINGSLWTIRYEFSLYLLVVIFLFIRKKPIKIIITASLLFLIWMALYQFGLDRFGGSKVLGMQGLPMLNLGGFFIAGVLLAVLDFKNWNKQWILWLGVILLAASLYFNFYSVVKHVLFPIVILGIGFTAIKGVSNFGKHGDPSYGIYIYAFPIQQILIFYFKFELVEFIIYSIILSIIMGYISWHFVEKKALKFKRTVKMSPQHKRELSRTGENSLKL